MRGTPKTGSRRDQNARTGIIFRCDDAAEAVAVGSADLVVFGAEKSKACSIDRRIVLSAPEHSVKPMKPMQAARDVLLRQCGKSFLSFHGFRVQTLGRGLLNFFATCAACLGVGFLP